MTSNDKGKDDHSQHISERSEEESPIPKYSRSTMPQKILHNNGPTIKLLPIEKKLSHHESVKVSSMEPERKDSEVVG